MRHHETETETSANLSQFQSTSANSYHTENPLIIDISSDSQEDVTQHANIVFHPFSSNIFGEISQKHLRLLNIIDELVIFLCSLFLFCYLFLTSTLAIILFFIK